MQDNHNLEIATKILAASNFKVISHVESSPIGGDSMSKGIIIRAKRGATVLTLSIGRFTSEAPKLWKDVPIFDDESSTVKYQRGTPSLLPLGTDSQFYALDEIAGRQRESLRMKSRNINGRIVLFAREFTNRDAKAGNAENSLLEAEAITRDLMSELFPDSGPKSSFRDSARMNGWAVTQGRSGSLALSRKGENIILPVGSNSAKINGKWIKFKGTFTRTHAPVEFKKYLTRK